MTRPRQPKVTLMRDLPGWEEACQLALVARVRASVSASHVIGAVGPKALATAGLFAAPPSIKVATVNLVLCLAIGVEASRGSRWWVRERLDRLENRNVVDFTTERKKRGLIPIYSWAADKALAAATDRVEFERSEAAQ
jgi:hypothetical protein